jgi:hypothetical protein
MKRKSLGSENENVKRKTQHNVPNENGKATLN